MPCTDNSNTNHTASIVLGFFAGAAIGAAAGAAIGMMFSPEKGSILRKSLHRKSEDIVQEIAESVEERIERLTGIITHKIEVLKDELISRVGA